MITNTFIEQDSFVRFLSSADGNIQVSSLEPVEKQEDRSLFVRFKDRQNNDAGALLLEYTGPIDSMECQSSFEMYSQGKGYGFELYTQLVRFNLLHPQVASQLMRASDRGRSVWTKFDGFEFTSETLEKIRKVLGPRHAPLAAQGVSPRQLANITLQNADKEILPIAKKLFPDKSEQELLEATKSPGKLALLRVQKWDARLTLKGSLAAYERWEKSVEKTWIERLEPHRYLHPAMKSVNRLWRSITARLPHSGLVR